MEPTCPESRRARFSPSGRCWRLRSMISVIFCESLMDHKRAALENYHELLNIAKGRPVLLYRVCTTSDRRGGTAPGRGGQDVACPRRSTVVFRMIRPDRLGKVRSDQQVISASPAFNWIADARSKPCPFRFGIGPVRDVARNVTAMRMLRSI